MTGIPHQAGWTSDKISPGRKGPKEDPGCSARGSSEMKRFCLFWRHAIDMIGYDNNYINYIIRYSLVHIWLIQFKVSCGLINRTRQSVSHLLGGVQSY